MHICYSCKKPNSSLHPSADFHGHVFALTCSDCIKQVINPRLQQLALQHGALYNEKGDLTASPKSSPKILSLAHLKDLVPNIKAIIWSITQFGYEVTLLSDREIIDSYSAGNHPQDSTEMLDPDDPIALPLERLRDLALNTAREIAAEHYIPFSAIQESEEEELCV